MLKTEPGTYALIFRSESTESIQVGRQGQSTLQPGYYIYVGSAFGPGGVQARVSRHLRTDKRKHWHIDFLRDYVSPVEVWISYKAEHLEHEWAGFLFEMPGSIPVQGFGSSDCKCYSHLFFTLVAPDSYWLGRVEKMIVKLNAQRF